MKKLSLLLIFSWLLVSFSTASAQPNRRSVGLGVSLGAAFPQGNPNDIQIDDWDASLGWGFHVNIPLIGTFHLTPSAELYRFDKINATDVSLAFKFIVPALMVDLYVGVAPGLTTYGDNTNFHIGGLGGLSFNLFSNLDLFAECKYKIIILDDSNTRVLHTNAGILFHF